MQDPLFFFLSFPTPKHSDADLFTGEIELRLASRYSLYRSERFGDFRRVVRWSGALLLCFNGSVVRCLLAARIPHDTLDLMFAVHAEVISKARLVEACETSPRDGTSASFGSVELFVRRDAGVRF